MSFFNTANEVAHETVYGRHYQNDEPCERPEGVTEHNGVLHGELHAGDTTIDLTGKPVNHETWAELARELWELRVAALAERVAALEDAEMGDLDGGPEYRDWDSKPEPDPES